MKHLLLMLAGALIVFSTPAFSQEAPPDCNASENTMRTKPYTRDQGDICIKEWEQKVKELEEKLNGLQMSIQKLNADLQSENTALSKSEAEIAALLEATKEQMDAFGQKIGVLEGKVRGLKSLGESALADRQDEVKGYEAELNAMRGNKISLYTPFFNRIVDLAREIRSLYRETKAKEYIVGTWAENRDCLWNIAGKADIYGDPFQWPKVWQGNTDQIRNPDIIIPGQRLKLPAAGPKTSDEVKAERSYWRKKRAAMVVRTSEVVPSATPSTPSKVNSIK